MQGTCLDLTAHISLILSPLNISTPRVSWPFSPSKASTSYTMREVVSATPPVVHLQWRASSPLHIRFITSSSEGFRMCSDAISDPFAVIKAFKSSLSHLKMHWLRWPMNSPYSRWQSVLPPTNIRLMKCQMSSLTCKSFLPENMRCIGYDPQQSRSTSRISGGVTCASAYLFKM